MNEPEEFIVGGCCGGGVDLEMKNAVAIQRNAAAIAAIIKTLQQIQSDVDELKEGIASPTMLSELKARLDTAEADISSIKHDISGLGGVTDRVEEVETHIHSLGESVATFDTRMSETNTALVATQSNLAKLAERVDELEDAVSGIDISSLPGLDGVVGRVDALEGRAETVEARMEMAEGRIEVIETSVVKGSKAIIEATGGVSVALPISYMGEESDEDSSDA